MDAATVLAGKATLLASHAALLLSVIACGEELPASERDLIRKNIEETRAQAREILSAQFAE